jgi:serine/threonine protein phosphatase PrpC
MKIHHISNSGKRPYNEDRYMIIINLDNKDKELCDINFYGIYDGHGGCEISEYLHQHFYKYFINIKNKYPLSEKYINTICNTVNNDLKKYKKKECNISGSTCISVIQYKKLINNKIINNVQILNIGDCRAVICRNNIAIPLTKDHKPDWPEEYKRLCKIKDYKKYLYNDDNIWRIVDLSVSRSFGDINAIPYVTHLPDIYNYTLTDDDKFIVIACDGLWDVMSNTDVVNFILHNYKNTDISKILTDYAIKNGSEDNITIIVIFLQ